MFALVVCEEFVKCQLEFSGVFLNHVPSCPFMRNVVVVVVSDII